jgi:hypothetical protein
MMPERPIILFGQPTAAQRKKLDPKFPRIQLPSHQRQGARIAPKLTALKQAALSLQQSPVGIVPEMALVFELAKDEKDFYTAVRSCGDGIEIIFDSPEEFETSDDFFPLKYDSRTKTSSRDDTKEHIGGKIYCVLTNAQALTQLLNLWERYKDDPNTPFSRGQAGFRKVFDCLRDIHRWGYKERIEETGILTAWNEDLQDQSLGNVRCEIELFFRKSADVRQQREDDLRSRITQLGGQVLGKSVIEEISYHAILAMLPRSIASSIIQNNSGISLLSAEQIMFFRPVGQSVYVPDGNETTNGFTAPSTDGLNEDPIIALLDGFPQQNHPYLMNRLIIDDPENYEQQYTVVARKHGTSMASLISLGDVSDFREAISHKIYVRPIMKAVQGFNGYGEEIPADILLVDKIHEAVRRLFTEEAGKVAPTIKVINLSIGIATRLFDRMMSPLARLLDWLSYTYRILFIVSAGNHPNPVEDNKMDIGMSFTNYIALDKDERNHIMLQWASDNARNLRLLSPAESMNALTVGAIFSDGTTPTENARFVLPCTDGQLSHYSSLGKGLNNSIKPDIVYPGGKNFVTEDIANADTLKWRFASSLPGSESASPSTGNQTQTAYSFGTSNSVALISHEASRCYDALIDVFSEDTQSLPTNHLALLIKAMLIHGAEWGDLKDTISQALSLTNRNEYSDTVHRFIGYGKPNIEKAIECAKKRVTLIGYGELNDGEAHIYKLPLPFDFNTQRISRRLTATLTYFTPIVASRQMYRAAQVWYTIENGKEHLVDKRIDSSDKAVTRGSVQHEIFENDEVVVWGEDDFIQLKVNCRKVADDQLAVEIPYALMVSFEIKSDIDIDVYTKVADRIAPKVTI